MDWTPKQKPAEKNLVGRFCILEPLDIKQHSDNLFSVLHQHNHVDSWTYLPYGPFADIAEFKIWLENTKKCPDILLYTIRNTKTNMISGIAGYLRITPEHGVVEIGHVHFSDLIKRTPAATEAIYLMMRYVFDELNYRRCEWKCNSLNQASRRAAERFGFTFEGIFRQHFVFKEQNRDTAWFSVIDSEWDGLKQKYEKWLNPNNFDETGKQLVGLINC